MDDFTIALCEISKNADKLRDYPQYNNDVSLISVALSMSADVIKYVGDEGKNTEWIVLMSNACCENNKDENYDGDSDE